MSSPRSLPVKATKSEQDAAVRRLRERWLRGGELKQTRKSGESLKAWIQRKGLKKSRNKLYTTLEFAERISTELELEVLLALRLPTGMPLTWSHFTVLMCVVDPKQRLKFARLAARKDLSSSSLRARIQAADPRGNRREGSGRKSLADTPLEEAVLRIRRQIGRLRRQLEALLEVDGAAKGPGSQILAKQLEVLLAALAEFEKAAKAHAGGQSHAKSQKPSR